MGNKLFQEAEVKKLKEGQFEVIASNSQRDRMGDTINVNGWYLKNYKKNPVILWSHASGRGFGEAIPPVAKTEKIWVEDDQLKIRGKFADTPFARELRTLVEGGFLNAVSVGFIPLLKDEKGNIEIDGKMWRRANDNEIIKTDKGVRRPNGEKFEKQELLEISWVSVPALPSALVTAKEMNLPLMVKALSNEEIENDEKDELKNKILLMEKRLFDLEEKVEKEIIKIKKETEEREKKERVKKSKTEKALIMADKMFESLLLELRKNK